MRATAGARQNRLAAWPRQYIEVEHAVGVVLGSPLFFQYIQAFGNCFGLRYVVEGRAVDVDGTGELNPLPRIHGPWQASDESGNAYRGIGQELANSADRCEGDIWFVPALHPSAATLTVSASSAGDVLFEATVPLGEKRPWPLFAPLRGWRVTEEAASYAGLLDTLNGRVSGPGRRSEDCEDLLLGDC